MAEYIEREAAMKILNSEAVFCAKNFKDGEARGWNGAYRSIGKMPAADVVEVVRCKDCKHMEIEPCGRYCHVWGFFNGAGDEGFCNYGERRESK